MFICLFCLCVNNAENLYFLQEKSIMIKLNKTQIEHQLPFYVGQTPLGLQFALELQYAYHDTDCFNHTCETPVYADDADNPNILLTRTVSPFGSVWVHLSGNTNYDKSDDDLYTFVLNQFALLSDEDLRATSGEKGAVCLHLYSPDLLSKLEKLFDGHIRDKWVRYNYRLNKEVFSQNKNWREKIPTGFEMRFSAESSDNFKNGQIERFDFTLMKDDKEISKCGVMYFEKEAYNSETASVADITIETAEEYRRKGFALLTCAAFIEHCLSHNLEPNWSCYHFNPDSQALAKKLGFEELCQRDVLILEK